MQKTKTENLNICNVTIFFLLFLSTFSAYSREDQSYCVYIFYFECFIDPGLTDPGLLKIVQLSTFGRCGLTNRLLSIY